MSYWQQIPDSNIYPCVTSRVHHMVKYIVIMVYKIAATYIIIVMEGFIVRSVYIYIYIYIYIQNVDYFCNKSATRFNLITPIFQKFPREHAPRLPQKECALQTVAISTSMN